MSKSQEYLRMTSYPSKNQESSGYFIGLGLSLLADAIVEVSTRFTNTPPREDGEDKT